MIDVPRLVCLCKHVYKKLKAEIMIYKLDKEEKKQSLGSRTDFIFKEHIDFLKQADMLVLSS